MALQIGQLRTDTQSTYMNDVTTSLGTANSSNPFGETPFTDVAILCQLQTTKVYYLTLKIKRPLNTKYQNSTYSNIKFLLSLQNGEGGYNDKVIPPQDLNKQLYEIGVVTLKTTISYFNLEIVFKPLFAYDRIVLRIDRNFYDVILASQEGYEEREIEIAQRHLYTLTNLHTQSNGWIKTGVQTRPGTLIVVNQEPIRIGRSGIYELNNGTQVTSLMVASPNNQINPFIIDYIYDDTSKESS